MAYNEKRRKGLAFLGLDFTDAGSYIDTSNCIYSHPISGNLTVREKEEVFKFTHFCDIIGTSYYYTNNLSSPDFNGNSVAKTKNQITFDDGIRRYSDRYRNTIQKLDKSLNYYSSIFFPEELRISSIGRKFERGNASKFALTTFLKPSITAISSPMNLEEKQRHIIEKFDSVEDFDEDVIEAEEEEEEEDDEFEEEDDDDYNAEKYFDDGEFDDGDEDGNDEVAF
ncbi:hypothetical protein KL921_001798 [Ogataea angusta]|uniref:DNA-directed RNA polymerase III subunit n=1 Tax=Pichia angusta TaxID=870730 RepID=A0AAN6I5X6_PICAN|nr:uncharacterized protein KL928_001982 [Ogataea angusta]KAG7811532.1 hypothetical protein KL921_001798 [Ogataea angusta]KAG7819308.1 hypothetical protein KL928_001982 [Ogataea angusta]KAG7835339.1 hypothetical protein KL943_002654 [Ogataea angusta]KAG7848617.1 hypothetical protein KL941_001435 [Ogataea angusta]KAG7860589.1 hypothetical protein KL939_002075 [Ogataea angusta]